MILDKIEKEIKNNNNIAIFYHKNPDFDCIGSAFALQKFLKNCYPKKIIMVVITEELNSQIMEKFPVVKINGQVKDNWLKNSLGIVVDTANRERICDERYTLCKSLIKIDHHPKVDEYAHLSYLVPKASSCCEILYDVFKYLNKKKIDFNIAQYLYAGILTDTNRFYYPSTTSHTLSIASELYEILGKEKDKIVQKISENNLEDILFIEELKKQIVWDLKNHIASLIIPNELFVKYKKIPYSYVNIMANVKGIDAWASIYFDTRSNVWKGSVRTCTFSIRELAVKYGGGGLEMASGFVLKSDKEFPSFLTDLKKITRRKKY